MQVPFWSGKTVVVAGGTGFLGGWLIRRLVDRGANVVALVRQPDKISQFSLEGLSRQTAMERGNLYDPDYLKRIFTAYDVDVFFHTGYGADVNRVLREPLECFRSAVESTWLALDLIRHHRPNCVSVISSTDKAYGSQALPYRESSALTPVHPYEVAKASQDLAAQSFGKVYDLAVGVTRCGNYFGPYDFNLTRLIPAVCEAVSQGQAPVLRSDGHFTRDFLYIEDAVEVQMLLAERLASDRSLRGQAFNFSYGEQLEVLEIVRRIARIAGVNLDPVVANDIQAEIRHMHLSSEKAETLLGWRPAIGFDEGLRRTVQWYLGYLEQLRPSRIRVAGPSLATALVTGAHLLCWEQFALSNFLPIIG